jgi:hypothetical protein
MALIEYVVLKLHYGDYSQYRQAASFDRRRI